MELTVPRALRPGDAVALVAPAGPPDPDRTAAGIALLRSWDLEPVVAGNAFTGSDHGYLAAGDVARLEDLHDAWKDPGIAGILALRGGYGTQRLVDGVDWDLVAAQRKLVVGFSDCTALLLAVLQRAGLACVHGPGVAGHPERLGEEAAGWFRRVISTTVPLGELPARGRTLVPGIAEGPLAGGNVTMLSTSVGTPDHPQLAGRIVLLEDVGERPYAVDRALQHLRRAGVLDGVAGLALDTFHGCVEDRSGRASATVADVVAEHAAALAIPAVTDLPLGHGPGQLAVPFGVPCRLDAAAGTVTFTGPALG
jgi:muramoyltetrapeptide carboxypeptidase